MNLAENPWSDPEIMIDPLISRPICQKGGSISWDYPDRALQGSTEGIAASPLRTISVLSNEKEDKKASSSSSRGTYSRSNGENTAHSDVREVAPVVEEEPSHPWSIEDFNAKSDRYEQMIEEKADKKILEAIKAHEELASKLSVD